MALKPQPANHLKEFHEFLKNTDTIRFQASIPAICEDLNISQSSFYHRMKTPAISFSKAEKEAIARVYQMPTHFIFPELQTA